MTNTNLALNFLEHSSHRLFSEAQIDNIDSLHIPTVIRFMLADRYDTKFINSTYDTWEFTYSGLKNIIKFDGLDYHEVKLLKYFLAYYIQILCTRQKKQKSLLKQRHNSNF